MGNLKADTFAKVNVVHEQQHMKAGTSEYWGISSAQQFLSCGNLGIEGSCPPGKFQELPKTLVIHFWCLNQPPLKLPGSSQVVHGETSQFRGNGCTTTWQL